MSLLTFAECSLFCGTTVFLLIGLCGVIGADLELFSDLSECGTLEKPLLYPRSKVQSVNLGKQSREFRSFAARS